MKLGFLWNGGLSDTRKWRRRSRKDARAFGTLRIGVGLHWPKGEVARFDPDAFDAHVPYRTLSYREQVTWAHRHGMDVVVTFMPEWSAGDWHRHPALTLDQCRREVMRCLKFHQRTFKLPPRYVQWGNEWSYQPGLGWNLIDPLPLYELHLAEVLRVRRMVRHQVFAAELRPPGVVCGDHAGWSAPGVPGVPSFNRWLTERGIPAGVFLDIHGNGQEQWGWHRLGEDVIRLSDAGARGRLLCLENWWGDIRTEADAAGLIFHLENAGLPLMCVISGPNNVAGDWGGGSIRPQEMSAWQPDGSWDRKIWRYTQFVSRECGQWRDEITVLGKAEVVK